MIRKHIYEMIGTFNKIQHYALLSILKRHKQSFSENSNGIFLDIMTLSDACMKDIIDMFPPVIELDDYTSSGMSGVIKN